MANFTDVAALIPTLLGCGADVDDADCARASMMRMSDADVVKILEETAALVDLWVWRVSIPEPGASISESGEGRDRAVGEAPSFDSQACLPKGRTAGGT